MHSLDNPQNKISTQKLPEIDLFFLLENEGDIKKLVILDNKKYQALTLGMYRRRVSETLAYLRTAFHFPKTTFTKEDGSDIDSLTVKNFYRELSALDSHMNEPKGPVRNAAEVTLHWIYLLQAYLDELRADNSTQANEKRALLQRLLDEKKSHFINRDVSVENTRIALISDVAALQNGGLSDLASFAYRVGSQNCLFKQLSQDATSLKTDTGSGIYSFIFESNLTKELLKDPQPHLLSVAGSLALGLKTFVNEPFERDSDKELFISRLQEAMRHDKRLWINDMSDVETFMEYISVPSNGTSEVREQDWAATYKAKWNLLQSILDAPVNTTHRSLLISYLGEKIYRAKLSVLSDTFRETNYRWMGVTEDLRKKIALTRKSSLARMMRGKLIVDVFGKKNEDVLVSSFKRQASTSHHSNGGIAETVNIWGGLLSYFKQDLKLDIETKNALLNVLAFSNYDGGSSFYDGLQVLYQRESYAVAGAKLDLPLSTSSNSGFKFSQWSEWYKDTPIKDFFGEGYQKAWGNLLGYFKKYNTHILDKQWALTPADLKITSPLDENNNLKIQKFTTAELVDQLALAITKMDATLGANEHYSTIFIAKNIEYLLYNTIGDSKAETRERVANEMVDAIKSDNSRFLTTKNSVLAVLYGVIKKEQAESQLLLQIKKNKATKYLSPRKIWCWGLDGNQQTSRGAYGFENEPGYMGGMFKGFAHILVTLDEKLSARYLRTLHDTAVGDVFVDVHAWREAQSALPSRQSQYKLKKNYRNGANAFGLRLGSNATQAGIKELKEKIQQDLLLGERRFIIEWANLDDHGQPLKTAEGDFIPLDGGYVGDVVTVAKVLSSDNELYAQKIIDLYYKELAAAGDNEKKLKAIVRVCRDLESVHLFEDGNVRTLGILLLNKLLLQNGFSPVSLHNPNVIDAFSLNELLVEIKNGQNHFKTYIRTFEQSASFSDDDSGIVVDSEDESVRNPNEKDSAEHKNQNDERRTLDQVAALFEEQHALWTKEVFPLAIEQNADGARSGLCYGETLMMAMSIRYGEQDSIARLANKFNTAASNPYEHETSLLKTALSSLHQYANQEYQTHFSTVYRDSVKTLDAITAHLDTVSNQLYELNTPNHTMLVGVVESGSDRRFYFCDTNRIIAAFDSVHKLNAALRAYFDSARKIRYKLNVAGDENALQFEFVPIDTEKLKRIKIEVATDAWLSIEQVVGEKLLSDLVVREQKNLYRSDALFEKNISQMDKDIYLKLSLSTLNSNRVAKNLFDAMQDMLLRQDVSADEIPLLPTVKALDEGGYSVLLINKDHPQETRTIKIDDIRFIEIKNYLDTHLATIKKSSATTHATEVTAVDGMNAGFAIQQLVTWMMERGRQSQVDQSTSASLTLALKVHTYLGLTQMAHATLQDLVHVGQIVSTLSKTQLSIGSSALHTANTGIGLVFGAGFVALDTWELTHTKNTSQKMVFGTQLAFDSASLLTSVASIGAGLTGASTVAACLGYIGVPIAGLGIGATALAATYGEVTNDAEQVGKTFQQINEAYKNKAYRFDITNKILTSLPHGVVKSLNLKDKTVSLGTQFIYAVDDGYTHNDVEHDRTKAISLRDALGYSDRAQSLSDDVIQALLSKTAQQIVLPATTSYYLNPYHQYLLSLLATTVPGLDVLKALEAANSRFKFECFHFPYKHLLRSMQYEFIQTPIDIILAVDSPTLIVPQIEKILHGYITYRIHGAGGEVLVNLNKGVNIELLEQAGAKTDWIIDLRLLSSDSVSISDHTVLLDGLSINVGVVPGQTIKVIKHDGGIARINWINNTLEDLSEDAAQWRQYSKESIETHLKNLAAEHRLASKYTPIRNYKIADNYNGLAYYDTEKDRMLFTQPPDTYAKVALLLNEIQAKPLVLVEEITRTMSYKGVKAPNKVYKDIDRVTYLFKVAQKDKLAELTTLLDLLPDSKWSSTLKQAIVKLDNQIKITNVLLLTSLRRLNQVDAGYVAQVQSKSKELEALPSTFVQQLKAPLIAKPIDIKIQEIQPYLAQLRRELDATLVPFKEGEIAGDIKGDIYFYHRNSALFWCVDPVTRKVKTQFKPFQSLLSTKIPERIRVWQEGDEVYARLFYTFTSTHPGDFTYRILGNQIQLVGITYDANDSALLNNLSLHNRINPERLKYLFMLDAGDAINIENATIASATLAPLIAVTGHNNTDVTFRYWISSERYMLDENEIPSWFHRRLDSVDAEPAGTIIKPHLPASEDPTVLTDLMFVGRVKQTATTSDHLSTRDLPDIFYFYCRAQKKLFRQVGPGPAKLDKSQGRATLINLPGLETVVRLTDNSIFATTQEGLAYQIDVAGSYHLAGVSARWFVAHKDDWKRDLDALAGASAPLAILGVTKGQQKNAAVWYFDGAVIALPDALKNTPLRFVSVSRDCLQQSYVVLFDEASGKIYKQPLLNQTAPFLFMPASSQNVVSEMVLQVPVPEAAEWFIDKRFKAVSKIGDTLRLITVIGEILTIDLGGELVLSGVDLAWQAAHRDADMLTHLKTLTSVWPQHRPAIVLEQAKPSAPIWYHDKTNKIINTNDLGFNASDRLQFIGDDVTSKGAIWFYSASLNKLYTVDTEGENFIEEALSYMADLPMLKRHWLDWKAVVFDDVQRMHDVIQITGTAENDIFMPPSIANAKTLILSGGLGADEYHLNTAWMHYETVVIDNQDTSQAPKRDKINLTVNCLADVDFRVEGADFFLLDRQNKHSLLLKNVLGSNAPVYGHLDVTLQENAENTFEEWFDNKRPSLTFQVEELVQKLAGFGDGKGALNSISIDAQAPVQAFPVANTL